MSPSSEASQTPKTDHGFSLVACARWEEDDIVEWIEYHRAIGVDHFYIYSNDDSPTILAKRLMPYLLSAEPIVTYRHWPIAGQQAQIYYHFLENYKNETEWFCFLDIDEFLVIKGSDSAPRFIAAFGDDCDAIYLNWLIYGNNFLVERDKDSVLFSHTRRAAAVDPHTKTITRSAAIDPLRVRTMFDNGAVGFWHFLNGYTADESRLRNVLNEPVFDYALEFPRYAKQAVSKPGISDRMIEVAYVAHFQIKSEQDFIRRAERGGFGIAQNWKRRFDDGSYRNFLDKFNVVEDFYLAALWASTSTNAWRSSAYHKVPLPPSENLALRKPSRQSSRQEKAPNTADAYNEGHANDGVRNGAFGFHTSFEEAPWWMVDLLRPSAIEEVHVYNRLAEPNVMARANYIAIEISQDADRWTEVFAYSGQAPFGGFTTKPLVVQLESRPRARFLRIISRKPAALHLDEVEVYGRPEP